MESKEEIISQYFSELAKKRKNPYTPFKDKAYAKEMARKSVETRRRNREANKATEGQDATKS